MEYFILDPRPIGAEKNNEILSRGNVLGIEVTIQALAEKCDLGNIDPQHSGSDHEKAAIEEAAFMSLPPAGARLVTIRADLDSVGAMAVISLRARGIRLSRKVFFRIGLIAEADKFARGAWQAKALPSISSPWPDQMEKELSAMALAVADFKVLLAERVRLMENWLCRGEEPATYRSLADQTRESMITALTRGEIKVEIDGRIAVVTSKHAAATAVGYCLAPVVVAKNPEFSFQGGEPHVKFTICQFQMGLADLKSAAAELSKLESGWGGSPTIIGSPQGINSNLSLETVKEVVKSCLF